jgi:hypothetical protein
MSEILENHFLCLITDSMEDTERVGIAQSVQLRAMAGQPGSIPSRSKFFLFSTASRPVLGPTQPRLRWVTGPISPG